MMDVEAGSGGWGERLKLWTEAECSKHPGWRQAVALGTDGLGLKSQLLY